VKVEIMELNETADTPGLGDQINLTDTVAVEHWAKLLGLTPGELEQAVQTVGTDYGDLVAHLADAPL
jgi:Na+-translocating ferredoxin:NAD+ oxidoreductase RnfG subunit